MLNDLGCPLFWEVAERTPPKLTELNLVFPHGFPFNDFREALGATGDNERMPGVRTFGVGKWNSYEDWPSNITGAIFRLFPNMTRSFDFEFSGNYF